MGFALYGRAVAMASYATAQDGRAQQRCARTGGVWFAGLEAAGGVNPTTWSGRLGLVPAVRVHIAPPESVTVSARQFDAGTVGNARPLIQTARGGESRSTSFTSQRSIYARGQNYG